MQLEARPTGEAARAGWHDAGLRWRLVTLPGLGGQGGESARDIARGSSAAWLPWPGRHRLELLDAKGQVLDSVRVEVRGAGALVAAPGLPARR